MTDQSNIIEHPIIQTAITPIVLLDKALATGNIEVIERMMALYERREQQAAKVAYYRAFARAKAEFTPIVKRRKASFGAGKASYSYEELDDVVEAVVQALSKHGLVHTWNTTNTPDLICVTCVLAHEDGYSEEVTLTAGPDKSGSKNDIQAAISSVTYLQRATLKAKCGLAAGRDDDAHAVTGSRIDADQLLKLENEMERVGVDAGRVCKYYGIEELEDLPAKSFDEAMKRCLQFEREARKAAS
jgi:hypothetical protein